MFKMKNVKYAAWYLVSGKDVGVGHIVEIKKLWCLVKSYIWLSGQNDEKSQICCLLSATI